MKYFKSKYGFLTKESAEEMIKIINRGIKDENILNSDVNRISMEKLEMYIENWDDIEEVINCFEVLLYNLLKFKSMHHREALVSQIIYGMMLYVPLEDNAKIGILESLKHEIFREQEKRADELEDGSKN